MKTILGCAVLAVWMAPGFAPFAKASEAAVQACLCRGLQQEVRLASGARADCLSDRYAIEIDRSHKWAEALGQALHYAGETGRAPMIYLYCAAGAPAAGCLAHRYRLEATIAAFDLPVSLRLFAETEVLARCARGRRPS